LELSGITTFSGHVVDCYSFDVNFSKTFLVRYNLDPFKEHSDTELWTALERAHLREMVCLLALRVEGNKTHSEVCYNFQLKKEHKTNCEKLILFA